MKNILQSIKKIEAFILVLMSCLMIQSCDISHFASEQSGTGKISVSVSLDQAIASADLSQEDFSFVIYGSGPGAGTFQVSTGQNVDSATVEDLAFGTWNITVEALYHDGVADPVSFGDGVAAAEVHPDSTTLCSVDIAPFEGQGNLDLTVNWNSSQVSDPRLEGTLSRIGYDETTSIVFTIGSGQATAYLEGLDSGIYSLALTLNDGADYEFGGIADSVRITNALTTTAEYTITGTTAPDSEAPSVPGNLRTTSVLSNRVILAWDASTDNVGVAGYRVYRGGNAIGTSTGIGYTDNSVAASSTYSYTVAAYDAAGNESAQSDTVVVTTTDAGIDSTIMDHRYTDASLIPDEWIETVKNNLHIAYQHTSHGSQIISGMNALKNYPVFGTRYQWSDDGSAGLDLDDYGIPGCPDLSQGDSVNANGDTPWVVATRTLLDNTDNNHINVVIWSWCSINNHNITRYITNMEKLITEYGPGGSKPRAAAHPVQFVFITGHTEATGESGFVALAAEQIRVHCVTNNRWLIDYYDLECYDPDGNYYGDLNVTDNLNYSSGAENWAVDYLADHDETILDILTMGDGGSYTGCPKCAHSDDYEGHRESTLNCVLKGQAAWHLFARIAGWDGN